MEKREKSHHIKGFAWFEAPGFQDSLGEVKEGEVTTRRNTIDLQFEGGARIRSRANTLELKLNGEVMKEGSEDLQSSPRGSRTLSVIRHDSTNGLPGNAANAQNLTIDNTQTWSAFNPKRQFYVLKAVFIMMCLVDIMHWAYMLSFPTINDIIRPSASLDGRGVKAKHAEHRISLVRSSFQTQG
ncbi:hypothetical protein ANCDUO_09803 [Ancylostoma duodenale]|uniref:Uncharacterized protein n=1 Tax=Ancylostoma duodenale TaxID=51022 RepID=A0A0C2GFP2_9BILA|nr:hypothetical protein ANCDUO_09803 [Ancylostoma duodenale]